MDFPNIKAVINFGLPLSLDDYVHRIGRTGRMGQKGLAVTLVGEHDLEIQSHLRVVARGICRLVHASSISSSHQLPTEFTRVAGWRKNMEDNEAEEEEGMYRRNSAPYPAHKFSRNRSPQNNFRNRNWN